jgi:hypothetical protein
VDDIAMHSDFFGLNLADWFLLERARFRRICEFGTAKNIYLAAGVVLKTAF